MDKDFSLIITASGTGERMGMDLPKQFHTIDGHPLLAYTINGFKNIDNIKEIIIVVPKDYKGYTKENIVDKYDFNKDIKIVAGGDTRSKSVYEGLKIIKSKYVLIHDGVRPFISKSDVENLMENIVKYNASILATKAEETIKYVIDEKIEKTLDRDFIYFAGTPQGFKTDLIKSGNIIRKNLYEDIQFTDDASILEYLGIKVHITVGSKENIKITTPEDLEYANFLIKKYEKPILKSLNEINGKIIVHTDGACSGNPGKGGIGVLIEYKQEKIEISRGFELTTNNRMEMLAVITALEYFESPQDIKIYSDSKYVVDAIEKGWVFNWEKNNWMRNNKDKALNSDLWIRLLKQIRFHNVEFNWVKGHSDNEGNIKADDLATSAINGILNIDHGYTQNNV